jgi:anaerobic selenocysteine-containing dehydrogenase
MNINRRDFLKISGTAGAGLALAGCEKPVQRAIPLLVSEEEIAPNAEKWISGLCRQCPGGCGLQVRLVSGELKKAVGGREVRVSGWRAVKIEGHPNHPVNRGGLCARGQAGLQVLYNPDRLRGPLARKGPRGSGKWEEITWDEGLGQVLSKLEALRQQAKPHALAFVTGSLRGHRQQVIRRFMEAFGSPNHFTCDFFSDQAVRTANLLTMGHPVFPAYDLEHANYLLSFGTAFLETSRSPVRFARGFGFMRQGRSGHRAKVVQIEPRLSLTAANADEWVAVRPGTEGALALGMAQVILAEEKYNKEFVHNNTLGFTPWRDLVLQEYTPEKVAEVSGVPSSLIKRLAQEFVTHRPSLAMGGDAAAAHTNGVFTLMAVQALNALVGSLGRPGGLTFASSPPLAPLPHVPLDPIARTSLAGPSLGYTTPPTDLLAALPQKIKAGVPYPVEALFLYEANPLFSLPAAGWEEALEKIPLVVSFSPFLDESTLMADLILPDHTYLERWDDDIPEPGLEFPAASVTQPVLPPLYDTRDTANVLIHLARSLGGSVGEAFPWESFDSLLKDAYQGIYQAQRGSVVAETFADFWTDLVTKGGWWDEEDKAPLLFRTRSGKFTFPSAPIQAPPHFLGEEEKYPFLLHLYQSSLLSDGRGANQPWLQELPDPMTSVMWESQVEINPKTAEELGIKEGEWVWIESPVGKVKARALLFPGIRPGMVSMATGQGHWGYGRYASERGTNPFALIPPQAQLLSGSLAWAGTRVRVFKA